MQKISVWIMAVVLLTLALNSGCAASEADYTWDLTDIYADSSEWEREYQYLQTELKSDSAAERADELVAILERLMLYPQLTLYIDTDDAEAADRLARVQLIDVSAIAHTAAADNMADAELAELDSRIESIRAEYTRLLGNGARAEDAALHVALLAEYVNAQTDRARLLNYESVQAMALPDIPAAAIELANTYAREVSMQLWNRKRDAYAVPEYTFECALGTILTHAEAFNSRELISELSTCGHVDAYPRAKKTTGSLTAVWSGEPYILLNFDGSYAALANAAHEYAHALCDIEARARRVELTTFEQETAALTFELGTLESMLADTSNEYAGACREALLAEIMSAYCTQGMYAEFERALYDRAWAGEELSADYIVAQWHAAHQHWRGTAAAEDYNWVWLSQLYYSYYAQLYVPAAALALNAISSGVEGSLITAALAATPEQEHIYLQANSYIYERLPR